MENKELAFLLGRIALGINFLAHGIVRLPKLNEFSKGMVKGFQETLIGFDSFIYVFSFVLVFVEFILGFTLILGLKTRLSLIIANFLMMCLIFGASMQEKWGVVGSQMVYVAFLFLLINGQVSTRYSIDSILDKGSSLNR
ncbi:DoxX family membrane protein [Galbibacter sp. BG1]|uniref:DoxX family protein n=1 Tax=Galbibacter sp. BG1 TaxID=1170699 RepID=UPI0015BF55D8|nr:DoxX family membrane protein [Galbibacter sp. BG1]QLE02654.1 DoxX family membrane protein [Galbibacter sp. BG1]